MSAQIFVLSAHSFGKFRRTVKARVRSQQDNRIWSTFTNGSDQRLKHLKHFFSTIGCAVIDANWVAIDKGEQWQVALAIVVAVKVLTLLKAESFNRCVVNINNDNFLRRSVLERSLLETRCLY